MAVSQVDRSTASESMVRDLSEVSQGEIASAGAKAVNLAVLIAAGLPVPPGFVVDAAAYEAFVDAYGLRHRIDDRLAGLDFNRADEVEQAAADIRLGFDMTDFPLAVYGAIRRAYENLNPGGLAVPVAVRSSTTTIDTSTEVFAHLNETVLCVRRTDTLLDAVRRCWSSLFTALTLVMRERLGLSHHDADVAVIVQRQIAATRSGFMVTGDPGHDAPDRLVIEAIYGLGEAVVSRLVAPDRFAVDKPSLAVLGKEVHHKGVVTEEQPPDGGIRHRAVSGEQADRAAMLDSEIREVARVGAQIEDHFGEPQVVEWALDRNRQVWVLQSCPLDSASLDERSAIGFQQ